MYRSKKAMAALCFSIVFTLSACGGGGGGSSDSGAQSDGNGTDDGTGNGTDDGTGNGTDDGTGNGTDDGTGDGTDDGTENGTDDGTDDGGTQTSSVTSVTVGGRTARALAAVGGPVAGVPGATMQSIDGFSLNDAGAVAYIGTYESGSTRTDGIWMGQPDSPALLFSTGTEVPGFASNVRFGNTEAFRLGEDGALVQIAQLNGPIDRQTLIKTVGGVTSTIVTSGDTLTGRSAEVSIGSLGSLSHGGTATAFTSSTNGTFFNSSSRTLWLSVDGAAVAVIEPFDSSVDSAAEVSNTCRIFSTSSRTTFDVSEQGDLIFDAEVRNYSSGPCERGEAVIRYKDGTYTSIVKQGDIVPGASSSTFADVDLFQVTNSGTAIVSANLETPTGDFRPDVKWSYWAFPATGEPRLIALEGEEIQIGANAKTFSQSSSTSRYLTVNESLQSAFRVDFGDSDEAALVGGLPHTGQPHAAIAAPGASSLSYAIDREATLPEPFLSSEFFSTIGFPAVSSNGDIVFYGEVTSSVLNDVTTEAVWEIDLEGNLNRIIEVDDTVKIAGIDNSLTGLVEGSSFSINDSGNIAISDAGALMFFGSTRSFFRDEVIVYVDPLVE